MTRFLIRTLVGLAIGAFFIWLSAREWPVDKLGGSVAVEQWHLVVGGAEIPESWPEAFEAAAPGERPAMSAEAGSGKRAGHGWVFDLRWVLPYLLVLTIIHFLRVIRWKPLLDPIVRLDFATHNRIGAVGFMAMFLFPLRLGELVRPYLVKKETGGKARMSEVLATVVVERIADGLMVSLLLFAVLAFLPTSDPGVGDKLLMGAGVALAVFLGATLLLAGARWQHDRTIRLIELTVGRLSKGIAARIIDILDAFLRGLKLLPSARSFAWFMFLTAVYWAINGVGTWMMAKAFYLPVDMVGAYAMMACVVVGMMIPNSPGNVGSFWYFLLIPTALYGVTTDSTQAIAFGLAVWAFQLLQQTAFGAWYILRGRVSLSRVMEATSQTEATLTAEGEPATS